MTIPRNVRPKRISAKQEARRRASGEKFLVSSVSAGGKKPIKKVNTERQQRMTLIRRQKHAAYRRSECYRIVEARSEGRCERMVSWTKPSGVVVHERCSRSRSDGLKMTHNHKTYARYGGKELPSDIELLCPTCNSAYESQKRGNRRFGARGDHQ